MKTDDIVLNIRTEVEEAKELSKLHKQVERFGASSAEIGAEVDGLVESINSIAEAQEIAAELAAANKALEEQSGQLKRAREEYRLASESLLAFGDSMSEVERKEAEAALKAQEREVNKLNRAYARAEKEVARANNRYEESSTYVKRLATDSSQLEHALDLASAKQEKLNKKLAGLKELSFARQDLGVEDYQKEIDKLNASYKTLKDSGKLTAEELEAAHRNLTAEVAKYERQLDGTNTALANMRKGMPSFLAVAGMFTKITKDAIAFESAMADVAKVLGASDEEIEKLSSELLELSRTIPLTAEGLAEIATSGAQIGLAADELMAYTEQVAAISVAFSISTDRAGKAVADLMNIFGMGIDGVNDLADAINHLSNNSAADAESIINVLTRIGGAGQNFGLVGEELAALSSGFLSLGMTPEIAATSIRNFLTDLATAESKGGDFQKALEKMGTSSIELSHQIRDNPQKAIVDFLTTLNEMDEAGENTTVLLTDLFGQANQANIATMANNVHLLADAFDMAGRSADYAGSVNDEFNAKLKTAEMQFQLLKNNIKALSIELGKHLLPLFNKMVEGFSSVVTVMGEFAEEYPTLTKMGLIIIGITSSIKVMGAALQLVGIQGKKSIDGLSTSFEQLNARTKAIMVSFRALQTAGSLFASAVTGWNIGVHLAENFAIVERFGIRLAATVHQTWVRIKGWSQAISKALVFDFDGARQALAEMEEDLHYYKEAERSALDDTYEGSIKEREKNYRALRGAHSELAESAEALKSSQESLSRTLATLNERSESALSLQAAQIRADKEQIDSLQRVVSLLESKGLSYSAIEEGITKNGQEAIDFFDAIARESQATSKIIRESFTKALSDISTPKELSMLLSSLEQVHNLDRLNDDDYLHLSEAMTHLTIAMEAGVEAGEEFDAIMAREVKTLEQKRQGLYDTVDAHRAVTEEIERSAAAEQALIAAQVKSLEAQLKLAQAKGDSAEEQRLLNELAEKSVEALHAQIAPLEEINEREIEALEALQKRREESEALTEAELQYMDTLKQSILIRTEEIAALKASAAATELNSNKKREAAAAERLLKATQKQSVATQSNVAATKEATEATEGYREATEALSNEMERSSRDGGFQSWLKDSADTALLSADAVLQLSAAVDDAFNRSYVGYVQSAGAMIEHNYQSVERVRSGFQEQVNTFRELERSINNLHNPTMGQIRNLRKMANSLDGIDKRALKGLLGRLEQAEEGLKSLASGADDALKSAQQALAEAQGVTNEFVAANREAEQLKERARELQERGLTEEAAKYNRAAMMQLQAGALHNDQRAKEARAEVLGRYEVELKADEGGEVATVAGDRENVERLIKMLKQDKGRAIL